jgi:hypothetical protein
MEIELGHDILLERFMGAPLQEGKMPLAKTTGIATGRAQARSSGTLDRKMQKSQSPPANRRKYTEVA